MPAEAQYVCKKCKSIVVITAMKVHTPQEIQAITDSLCSDCAQYPSEVKRI